MPYFKAELNNKQFGFNFCAVYRIMMYLSKTYCKQLDFDIK